MLCIEQTEESFVFWQFFEKFPKWDKIFSIEKQSLGFIITDFPAVLHAPDGSTLFYPGQITFEKDEFQINVEKWTIRQGLINRQNHTVIESPFFLQSNYSSEPFEPFDILFVHPLK